MITVEEHNKKIKGLDSFYLNLIGVKLCIFQPNPMQNMKDDEDRSDCAIRAISKYLNKSWEDVFKEMSEHCIKTGTTIGDLRSIEEYVKTYGLESIDEGDYYSVADFMYHNKKGKYLVAARQHIVCYQNGKLYDSLGASKFINYFLVDEIKNIFTIKKGIKK